MRKMKKKTILTAAALIVILSACVLFFVFQNKTRFEGERISNPDSFSLRFDSMNGADSETMALQAGDTLHVSWKIESGSVNIVIGQKNEEPVYQANDRAAGDEADFSVEIPKTGDYTITVNARQAKGRIDFVNTKQASGETNE